MNPRVDRDEVTALAKELAARLGGSCTPVGTWFDGFWDFFVANRDRITGARGWEIQGGRWAVLLLDAEAERRFEIHVFVECRDSGPSARAPWPVSSIELGMDAAAGLGAPDAGGRPHDHGVAEELRGMGFDPQVGHWGVHLERWIPFDSRVRADVKAALQNLPAAVRLAFELVGLSPKGHLANPGARDIGHE